MFGAIAVEEHFLPRGGAELLASPGWFNERSGRGHRSAPDTDRRLEEMDACGIEHAVLHSPPTGFRRSATRTLRFAPRASPTMQLLRSRAHPDRYSGFVALPMRQVPAGADKLERAVRQLGFRGALIKRLLQCDNSTFG